MKCGEGRERKVTEGEAAGHRVIGRGANGDKLVPQGKKTQRSPEARWGLVEPLQQLLKERTQRQVPWGF